MKRLTIILLFVFCFESCIENRIECNWAEIRNSCSIEEYQIYLIKNPHSIHLHEVIDSLKKFWEIQNFKTNQEYGHTDCFGNCLPLIILNNNQIRFNSETTEKEKLKEKIKYSISNPDDLTILPEKVLIKIPKIGNVLKSKGFIDIISEDGFKVETYSEIIEIAKKSFLEIRNEYAIAIFNKSYDKLEKQKREIIELIVPMNIRFERLSLRAFDKPEPPVPPIFDN